jgi:hypothetical protein
MMVLSHHLASSFGQSKKRHFTRLPIGRRSCAGLNPGPLIFWQMTSAQYNLWTICPGAFLWTADSYDILMT